MANRASGDAHHACYQKQSTVHAGCILSYDQKMVLLHYDTIYSRHRICIIGSVNVLHAFILCQYNVCQYIYINVYICL